jgi:hypothetical protein
VWELCRSKSGECSEYCCCEEMVEVTRKFTWIGKNVEYILNHPDFNAMLTSSESKTTFQVL